MSILHILVFAFASLPFMWHVPVRLRPWGLLIGSLLAVAWMTADTKLEPIDYIILAATWLLTCVVAWVIQPAEPSSEIQQQNQKVIFITMLFASALLILLDVQLLGVFVISIGLVWGGGVSLTRLLPSQETDIDRKRFALFLIAAIIITLVILKFSPFAAFSGEVLNHDLISSQPIAWLGFSYLAFRLMAVLFDYRAGRLPADGFHLRDLFVYSLFFPSYTAGPIDRTQRFIPELNEAHPLNAARLVEGFSRIAIGIFKKFIIADQLALMSIRSDLIQQTDSAAGLWVLVYLYTFQIYFDFSGYSDVAIGLGRLYGITLPENFDRPYLQPNLQQFWNRWHMTLSTWFRVYYFTPFSRMMLQSRFKMPQWMMIFLAQLTTMILIGLWHGITFNFVLWGLWHGLGLFGFRILSDRSKAWYKQVSSRRWSKNLLYRVSVFATFHYVALGWVFFALPNTSDSISVFMRLFGLNGL